MNQAKARQGNRQNILLKADDLVFDKEQVLSTNWVRFLDFLNHHELKAGLGVIGKSLEEADDRFAERIRRLQVEEGFELWNHGYDHQLNGVDEQGLAFCEFQQTAYEYQLEHILRTQRIAMERLALVLRTFGAPGNAIDSNTAKALNNVPEIEVWLFGQPSSKFVLERSVDVEHPVIRPNFAAFRKQYEQESSREYLLLQLHPGHWSDVDFGQFTQIMEYLMAKSVKFTTPYAYYLKKKAEAGIS